MNFKSLYAKSKAPNAAEQRAAKVAGQNPRHVAQNVKAAIATTRGKPFQHNAAPPKQKPRRMVVLRKSAKKGPAV